MLKSPMHIVTAVRPMRVAGLAAALILSVTSPLFAQAFHPDKLAAMDAAIETAVAKHQCPGGILWLEHDGIAYHKAYGHRALVPRLEPMPEATIFDMVSLAKVFASPPAIMLLIERGQLQLDAPVCAYIPE